MDRKKPLTKTVTKETLEDLYVTKGNSLEDIAKMLGCTRTSVQHLLIRHGIQRRKRSHARVLAISKGKFERFTAHDIDEDFFSMWTPAMAWVLGLIFTDGCMDPNRISISSVDLELLEKVRRHLRMSKDVVQKTQSYDKSKKIYLIEFYREKMRQDLENLGLTPRKSLTMVFPTVPPNYVRHFIRGCWDGDGSVFMSGGQIRASYVCGSRYFVESMVHELRRVGIQRIRPARWNTKAGKSSRIYTGDPLRIYEETISHNLSYYFRVDSESNLNNLFHFFYDGVDETVFLERKYNTLAKGLKLTEAELLKTKSTSTRQEPIPVHRHHEKAIPDNSASAENLGAARARIKRLQPTSQSTRVLIVDNRGGKRMTCSKCGIMPDAIHLTDEAYCSACFYKQGGDPGKPEGQQPLPL